MNNSKNFFIYFFLIVFFIPLFTGNGFANSKIQPKLQGNPKDLKLPWVGYVDEINGKVLIKRMNTDGKKIIAVLDAKKKDLIHQKDEINVAANSNIKIKLTNGNNISLAPNTVFKIHKHIADITRQESLFNLLWGNIRATVSKLNKGSSFKLYTPNSTIGVRGTEFVVQYKEKEKTTKIACVEGKVAVETEKNTGDKQVTETMVSAGEYSSVETTYDNEVPVPLVEKPKNITRKMEGAIERSFYTTTSKTDPWDFTDISTSLLRIKTGYEYFMLDGNSSNSLGLYYIPTFLLFSNIHLEPYFGTSITRTYFIMRTGGKLNYFFYKGLYAGAGLEFMWITNIDDNKFYPGISMNTGYSFINKIFGVIDGVNLTYTYNSGISGVRARLHTLLFGVVVNLSSGRETW